MYKNVILYEREIYSTLNVSKERARSIARRECWSKQNTCPVSIICFAKVSQFRSA